MEVNKVEAKSRGSSPRHLGSYPRSPLPNLVILGKLLNSLCLSLLICKIDNTRYPPQGVSKD